MKTYERVVQINVDPQNGFMYEELPVPEGDQVVPKLNEAKARTDAEANGEVVVTGDQHPAKTNHFDKFPVHCVKDTKGAEFHPDLNIEGAVIVDKGTKADVDDFSGFDGFAREDGRPLVEVVQGDVERREAVAVVIGGLATDYCVRDTALDARKFGFDTFVMTDAIRAAELNPGDGQAALDAMEAAGVRLITTQQYVTGEVVQLAAAA